MDLSVNYDYSADDFQAQYKKIKHELLQGFSRLTHSCTLMLDVALLRNRGDESEFISVLKLRKRIEIPVASQYLTQDFFPWLIPLDLSADEDVDLLDKSIAFALGEIEPQKIKSGYGRLVCGWLASHMDAKTVSTHLGEAALQRNKNKDILLRYYDPAVATLLWQILDDWQRKRLLGPVITWYSIDGDGQLFKRNGVVQHYIQLSCSLSLSPESWNDINLIAITNLILREYRLENKDKPRLSETQVFQRILPALQRAVNYQFKIKEDLIAYGLHALRVSPNFDCHPKISHLLETQHTRQARSYRELIAGVSQSQWEHIGASEY